MPMWRASGFLTTTLVPLCILISGPSLKDQAMLVSHFVVLKHPPDLLWGSIWPPWKVCISWRPCPASPNKSLEIHKLKAGQIMSFTFKLYGCVSHLEIIILTSASMAVQWMKTASFSWSPSKKQSDCAGYNFKCKDVTNNIHAAHVSSIGNRIGPCTWKTSCNILNSIRDTKLSATISLQSVIWWDWELRHTLGTETPQHLCIECGSLQC